MGLLSSIAEAMRVDDGPDGVQGRDEEAEGVRLLAGHRPHVLLHPLPRAAHMLVPNALGATEHEAAEMQTTVALMQQVLRRLEAMESKFEPKGGLVTSFLASHGAGCVASGAGQAEEDLATPSRRNGWFAARSSDQRRGDVEAHNERGSLATAAVQLPSDAQAAPHQPQRRKRELNIQHAAAYVSCTLEIPRATQAKLQLASTGLVFLQCVVACAIAFGCTNPPCTGRNSDTVSALLFTYLPAKFTSLLHLKLTHCRNSQSHVAADENLLHTLSLISIP